MICHLVSMIWVATKFLAKRAPNRGAGEDHNGILLEVSGSSLAADGPAERVTQGASGVLRAHQCRRSKLGVGRGEDFSHLLDSQVGSRIGNAGSVVEEIAMRGFHF